MDKLKKLGVWLAGIAAVVLGALLVFLKLKEQKPESKPAGVPEASKETEKAVQQAEVKAAGEVASATATATAKTEALAGVAEVDDAAERRKKLADLANKA